MFTTNYYNAIHWLNNSFVICNNIAEVDPSVIDNARFSWYDDENDTETEVFQWFITDATRGDVEYLEQAFPGLLFTFSDLLDCFILCVDHYGTSWDYVSQDTTNEHAAAELGEKIK